MEKLWNYCTGFFFCHSLSFRSLGLQSRVLIQKRGVELPKERYPFTPGWQIPGVIRSSIADGVCFWWSVGFEDIHNTITSYSDFSSWWFDLDSNRGYINGIRTTKGAFESA